MRVKFEYNGIELYVSEYISFDTHYKTYWFTRQVYNYVSSQMKMKPFIDCIDAESTLDFTLKIESKGKYTLHAVIDIIKEACMKTLALIFEDKMYPLDTALHQYPISVYFDTIDSKYIYSQKAFYYKNYRVEDWKDDRKLKEIVNKIISLLSEKDFILDDDYNIYGKMDSTSILPEIEIQYTGSFYTSSKFSDTINSIMVEVFNQKDFIQNKESDNTRLKEYFTNAFSSIIVADRDGDVKKNFLVSGDGYSASLFLSLFHEDSTKEKNSNFELQNTSSLDAIIDEVIGIIIKQLEEHPGYTPSGIIEQKDTVSGKVVRRYHFTRDSYFMKHFLN